MVDFVEEKTHSGQCCQGKVLSELWFLTSVFPFGFSLSVLVTDCLGYPWKSFL